MKLLTSSHLEPAVRILLAHTPGAAKLGEGSGAGEVNAALVVVQHLPPPPLQAPSAVCCSTAHLHARREDSVPTSL